MIEVVSAGFGEILRELALGGQGVGGNGLVSEVEGVEHRDGHPDLVRAFLLLKNFGQQCALPLGRCSIWSIPKTRFTPSSDRN